MSQDKKIQEIADSVADITLELMEDSIHWQLESYPADGDDYDAVHEEVMFRAIEKMWFEIKKGYYEKPDKKDANWHYKQNTITQR